MIYGNDYEDWTPADQQELGASSGQLRKHIVSWDSPSWQPGRITSLARVSDPSLERIHWHQEKTAKTSPSQANCISSAESINSITDEKGLGM